MRLCRSSLPAALALALVSRAASLIESWEKTAAINRVAVLPQSSVDGHSSRLGAAARSRALRSAERSVTWASDRNGDPALLVALADVYVSLDDLLQRIAAVDDGLHVPRFDQVREHGETP